MQNQGRYVIQNEIASGATATVYLAEDIVLHRKVALKKLHPHLWNHAETVRRFEKEAVAVASLSHENIIKVYDFGSQDRGLFLAMEYVDGVTLDQLLKDTSGGLPNWVALIIFRQLLSGLTAAHKAGIVHRDLKPSNVLVDSKGFVRIADFGIAFLTEETSFTKTGSFLGTPGYSAPEQVQGLSTTDKTDIFALGVLFYRCITGKIPFEAETPHAVLLAIMEKMPTKANRVNRRLVPGLAELIESMIAKIPGERPSSEKCLAQLELISERNGFELESDRVCRFASNPVEYAKLEYQEIAHNFLTQARRAQKLGTQREAMQLFSLTEIFAEEDSDVSREVRRILESEANRLVRRKWTKVALMVLGVLGLCFGLFKMAKSQAKVKSNSPLVKEITPGQPKIKTSMVASSIPESTVQVVLPIVTDSVVSIEKPIRVQPKKPITRSSPLSSAPIASVKDAPSQVQTHTETGFLLVKSNPPFAKVRVDGKAVGTTPFKVPMEMAVGTHRLVLEKEGCVSISADFNVSTGETTALRYSMDKDETVNP